MMRRLFRRIALVGVLGTLAGAAVGAETTGKIAGVVTEAATGQPLPGVQIVIEETGQGTVTNLDGYYMILNVRPGTYTLLFKYLGYADVRVTNVQVEPDKTTPLDVRMEETVIEGEEVVVVAERPIVQMDRTTTTAFVGEEELEALPVTNLGEVINQQAGVVDGHFRGGRLGEVAYLINGVPINNPYTNSAALEVEKNMVSALEVISGVFNAEYGQAMSGVVNIVTKGVPRRWTGSFAVETGGVVSSRELEFVRRLAAPGAGLRYDDFTSETVSYTEAARFPGQQDLQLSLGGPLWRDRLGLRVTGRYLYSEGHVIGRRLFMPSDSSQNLSAGNPETWLIESTGDQAFVPSHMRRYSFNGALTYQLLPGVRLEYNLVWQDATGRNITHQQKYVPDGINRWYNSSQLHLFSVRLTPSARSFANLNYSYLRDRGASRLYDVPEDFTETGLLDRRYVSSRLSSLEGGNAFDVGGNDLFNARDRTVTHTFLADYTNQISRVHQIKAGFSARLHRIDNGSYGIEVSSRTGWLPMPSPEPFARDTLRARPYELAAYVQDKMEFKNLIVNAGLRFDYFDPDYEIPLDWTQANQRYIPVIDADGQATGDSLYNRRPARARYQISPRLGIAFPISATGVIRFSAGLFFQVPQLSILYTNPEYEVNPADASTYFGNPALNPERTLHFEVGLQQGLTEDLGVELTLFAKDIRNLTGVEIQRDVRTTTNFVRYINRDVGATRGITFSLYQRPGGPVTWDLDYTLQFAGGTSSDPDEAFQRYQSGEEAILSLVRLDWDRRHVLNASITVHPGKALSLTLFGRYQTGTPYTTIRRFIRSYIKNNADRPSGFITDLRLYLRPPVLDERLRLILQVDNLFDAMIHYGVYEDTGRGDESVTKEQFERTGTQPGGVNSLDEYFFRQSWFSAPRQVYFGLRYDF